MANIIYIGLAAELAQLEYYATSCEPLRASNDTTYKFESPKYLEYEEYFEINEDKINEEKLFVIYFTSLLIVLYYLRIIYKFKPQTVRQIKLLNRKIVNFTTIISLQLTLKAFFLICSRECRRKKKHVKCYKSKHYAKM